MASRERSRATRADSIPAENVAPSVVLASRMSIDAALSVAAFSIHRSGPTAQLAHHFHRFDLLVNEDGDGDIELPPSTNVYLVFAGTSKAQVKLGADLCFLHKDGSSDKDTFVGRAGWVTETQRCKRIQAPTSAVIRTPAKGTAEVTFTVEQKVSKLSVTTNSNLRKLEDNLTSTDRHDISLTPIGHALTRQNQRSLSVPATPQTPAPPAPPTSTPRERADSAKREAAAAAEAALAAAERAMALADEADVPPDEPATAYVPSVVATPSFFGRGREIVVRYSTGRKARAPARPPPRPPAEATAVQIVLHDEDEDGRDLATPRGPPQGGLPELALPLPPASPPAPSSAKTQPERKRKREGRAEAAGDENGPPRAALAGPGAGPPSTRGPHAKPRKIALGPALLPLGDATNRPHEVAPLDPLCSENPVVDPPPFDGSFGWPPPS